MKWLLFLLLVVVVAFFVADVVARNTAEKRVEERLASSVESANGLEVNVGGTLFLPQLFSGSFDEIEVSIDSIERGGLTVDDVEISLRDVDFSFGDLMDDSGAVTVRGGGGRALISERSLSEALRRDGVEAEIRLDGGATISAAGRSAEVQDVSVDNGAVVFSAPPLEPLRVDLPATLASVRYSGASVQGDHLVVRLRVGRGKVDL